MKLLRIVALAICVLLTGCLVPERFAAKVAFNADGSYTFTYQGTAIHALAAAQAKSKAGLTPSDNEALRAEAAKLAKDAEVKSASYDGDARFNLKIATERKSGETLRMFDMFAVQTGRDGVVTIASIELGAKGKRDLESLGIKIDGTLEVELPKNAEVIETNATSAPRFFGLFGGYSWKIGGLDKRPVMKIRFKK